MKLTFSERTNWKLSQNRFTQAVEEVRARGGKILDLTGSNPTRVGLAYDAQAILTVLSSRKALDYDPQAKGLLTARQAVAGYYRDVLLRSEKLRSEKSVRSAKNDASNVSRPVDPECIVLTTSTSEGYSFVFRLLCNPGDELLVPKPSYPLFEFLADLQDVKLVPYPLIYDHGWQIDLHSVEKVVTARTRGVVLVHPNNPTGSYVKLGEVEMLNSVCSKRGLALIVDEVFLDYELSRDQGSTGSRAANNEPGPYGSFAHNHEVLTFTLSGLSKISALPQMKVAWIVTSGPQEQVSAAMERLGVIADTYLSMNAPVQWAVPALLEQRENVQTQLLDRVTANLAELDRQLASRKICDRLKVEGGWYAILRVPVTRSDEDLAIELVRHDSVLVHPGHFYDFPSDGYLVLSLIGVAEEFRDGVARLLNHFRE